MSKLLKYLLAPILPMNIVEGDVGAMDGGEVVGTNNDARIALLNGIADGNDRGRADELADINDDETTSEFVAPAEEETQASTAEVEEVAQETVEEVAQPAEVTKHKIKVNGQELELTYEQILERAQKVASADQYLAEAARLRNDAIRQQQTQPSATADAATTVEDDLALARAIQMGTEEEAVAALRKLRATGPSQDDIAHTIDARLSFNEALSKFKTDFPDITGDTVLNHWAIETDKELVAQGDRRPYLERYQDIGNRIRAWKTGLAAGAPATAQAAAPAVNKEERKASAPAAPRQAAGKTQTSVVEEREESTSDVIANMARSRGGPQWMQGQQ